MGKGSNGEILERLKSRYLLDIGLMALVCVVVVGERVV